MEKIQINGIEYTFSIFDTEQSITNKVALIQETLPEYIKINELDFDKQTGTFLFLKDILMQLSIGDVLDKLELLKNDFPSVESKYVILEYIRLKFGNYKDLFSNMNNYPVEVQNQLTAIYSKLLFSKKFVDFWNKRSLDNAYNSYLDKIRREYIALDNKVKKENQHINEYTKYKGLETTKFIQDSIIQKYVFETRMDLLDIFNGTQLTSEIPFCKLNINNQNYYKVYVNKIPKEEWLRPVEMNEMQCIIDIDDEITNTVTIQYKNTETPELYQLEMMIESTLQDDIEEVKEKVLSIFTKKDFVQQTSKSQGIRGVFAIEEFQIARDVFLDLITNDPLVSFYIYTDESRVISEHGSSLYIYYSSSNNSKDDILTCYLSSRITGRSDVFYKNNELSLFSPYLNVRVSRARDITQVKRFMRAFSIILKVYETRYKTIVNKYKPIFSNFIEANPAPLIEKQQQEKNIRALQDKVPDLFIYGYPTKCERKKQPVPIDDPNEYNEENVMTYPLNTTNYFYCPSKDYPYPGLLKNKLENKDVYPFLPCCYPENQLKGNKLYNRYKKGIVIPTNQNNQTVKNYVRYKAIGLNKNGLLPRNVYYLLHDIDASQSYYRMGTPFDNNSLIHCVLLAKDSKYQQEKNKKKYAEDARRNLASIELTSINQTIYNFSKEKITKLLLNNDEPLDSKYFIHLLEIYFKCSIIVFERSSMHPNSTIEIPHFSQGYLYRRLSKKRPLILIYKHTGIRSDHLESPHYELIVHEDQEAIYKTFNEFKFKQTIQHYYEQCYQIYIPKHSVYTPLNINIRNSKFKMVFNLFGQSFDSFGKTRKIHFEWNNIKCSLFTYPLPPFEKIPELKDTVYPVDKKHISSLIDAFKQVGLSLAIKEYDVVDNKLYGVLFTNNFYLPLIPTPTSRPTTFSYYSYPLLESNDILSTTQKNKKIADYLMQYVLYSFSLYFEKNHIQPNQDIELQEKIAFVNNQLKTLVNTFTENSFIIRPSHTYQLDTIIRKFTMNNSFIENNKIIVTNSSMKKKLTIYLKFMIEKNTQYVIEFYKQTYLNNYYIYSNDFIQFQNNQTFITTNSLINWLKSLEKGIVNTTSNLFLPNNTSPYFFSDSSYNDGQPVLIQNVMNGSLLSALAVCINYATYGINTGYYTKSIQDTPSYTVLRVHNKTVVQESVGKHSIGTVLKYGDEHYAAVLYI